MAEPASGSQRPPRILSHYRIGRLLGSGAMGAVYEGTDRRDKTAVAIKLLHAHLTTEESFRERFEREAHVGVLLRSPYTVRLLDYGVIGGHYFIVMEYVDGQTLKEALQGGPLPLQRALRIATQVARALEEAQARGVVHRDIKPENILLRGDDSVRVSDFGIARHAGSATLTVPGAFIGTLSYAAPEQLLGRADHRSDIYSLGASLYHMLAGRSPFSGTVVEMLRLLREELPSMEPLAGQPPAVIEVVRRCLEKDPDNRYQSATELAVALGQASRAAAAETEAATVVSETVPEEPPRKEPEEETEIATQVVRREEAAPPPSGQASLHLGPPLPAPLLGARLRAVSYDLTVRNEGDAPVELQLQAADQENQCRFKLPSRLSLPPRGWTTVKVKVAPRVRRWRGGRESHPFTVSAEGGGGGPPTTIQGQFDDLPYGWMPYGGGAVLGVALAAVIAVALLLSGGDDDKRAATIPTVAPTVAVAPTPTPTAVMPTPGPFATPRIAFHSERDDNLEVYVMNDEGSGLTRLTDNAVDDFAGAWSPDGKRIAFVSGPLNHLDIYVMNADGSDLRRLTDDAAADLSPAWSPDGSQIAFHSNREGNDEVYVISVDGTGVRNLTQNDASDGDPAWSPDGSRIAFQSDRDGDFEIYVMNTDGSGQARLTDDPARDRAPAWSPDCRSIAFDSDRLDRNFEIYVMDADRSNLSRLTDSTANDGAPAWSPDGSRIAFTSDRDGNFDIYVMDADGSNLTQLTDNQALDAGPDWLPLPMGAQPRC